MKRLIVLCCLAAAGAAAELHEVRQAYALPAEDFLSLHIDAYGADVVVETGPAGMVEAVFHVPDTLHPPVFQRYEWADSGELGSFQFVRNADGPPAPKGELWEVRVPPGLDFLSILHAGFADVALWDVDEMAAYFTADSANVVMDMSSLESGRLNLTADAMTGDVQLHVPRTAEVFVVAECTLGVFSAPGFEEVDLDQFAIPEADFAYLETQQGRQYTPEDPGGAGITLLAYAAQGDVSVTIDESE